MLKMNKMIVMAVLTIGTIPMTQAAFVPLVWRGMETAVPGALATNGYIATHWVGTDLGNLTLLGATVMVDAYDDGDGNGSDFEGYGWIDFSINGVQLDNETQYYAATRVFQYQPGVFIGSDEEGCLSGYDVEYKTLDLSALATFWDLIQGTEVMQVEVGSYFVTGPYGLGATVNTPWGTPWPEEVTLTGTPDTVLAVPEPATYAALGGLVMLVFAVLRRRDHRQCQL